MTIFLVMKGHDVKVSLADAKTHLSALIDQVQHGETVEITRHGKNVAILTPAKLAPRPINVARLRAFAATIPQQPESAAKIIREMRDGERY